MDQLFEYMRRQLGFAPRSFTRYAYERINWDGRMLGIVGPRGVGKTTLLLQRIAREHSLDDTLYVSADQFYFAAHSLYEAAETFNKHGGLNLFIDEVHKYPGWSRELKMMYDSLPDLNVRFTGSSVLDITEGEADLSRRAPLYHMQGLSFREYLEICHGIEAPVLSLEDILANKAQLPGVAHPLPLFEDYLVRGYYPFGSDAGFATELEQVIRQTLEVDIPQYARMTVATSRKLAKLLSLVSTLSPFKPNMSSLAGQIEVSRNSLGDYIGYMEKAGLVAQLRDGTGGLGSLGKVEKLYLDNTNIMRVLGGAQVNAGSMRETFFFNQMRVNHHVTSSAISDFQIGDITFEIGGKGKGTGQLKGAKRGYVAADDIEYGHGSTVPLWAFGLNY